MKLTPSDSEASSSKKRSIGAEKDVVELDAETARNSSSGIVRDHTHGIVETDASRIALCPAQKLPPEIVAEIFALCFLSLSETADLPCYRYDPPLLLCQICSAWRQVALGTSQLWSSISLYPDAQQISSGSLLGLAKSWISRSSCSPLTIHYSIDHPLSSLFVSSSLNPVLDIIVPFSNRLREISLSLPPHCFTPLWLLPPNSMELLEILHLKALDNGEQHQFYSDWTIPANVNVFDCAPRLHRATFVSRLLIVDVEAMHLPWPQLTHLDFINTFISPDACHLVLRLCTKLVSCVMGVALGEKSIAHAPTIRLPDLTTFQLHLVHFLEIGIFLEPFVFPVLEAFEVSSGQSINWSQSAFVFLSSLSLLKKLSISHCIEFEGRELVPSLQNMPFLEQLEILEGNILVDGYIINMLCRPDFLPKLEVANLYVGNYAATNDLGIVVEMLELRWWPLDPNHPPPATTGSSVSRLKQVVLLVFNTDDIDDESRERFDDFIREGMVLEYVS